MHVCARVRARAKCNNTCSAFGFVALIVGLQMTSLNPLFPVMILLNQNTVNKCHSLTENKLNGHPLCPAFIYVRYFASTRSGSRV